MSLVQDINNEMFGIMAYAGYLELLYVLVSSVIYVFLVVIVKFN